MKWIQSDFQILKTLTDEYNPELVAQLEQFHIHTLEDFIALWGIEDLNKVIAEATGISLQKMEELVAVSRRQVALETVSTYLKPLASDQLDMCQFGALMPFEAQKPALSGREYDRASSKAYHVEIGDHTVNHIPSLPPIQNQGRRGTCVGFGTTVVREFCCNNDSKLSEQVLYWGAKERDGIPDQSGTWISYAIQCLEEDGICKDVDWPYNPDPGETEGQGPPPEKALQNAKEFKILKGNPIPRNSVDSMRAVLSGTGDVSGRIISFAIPVYRSWHNNPITYRTGKIQLPLPGEEHVGGHCMALVGFQDDDTWPGGGYFILRNSWGTQWASECEYGAGYGTIPYAFIAEHCWDAWTVEVEEQYGIFNKSEIKNVFKWLVPIILVVALIAIVGGIVSHWPADTTDVLKESINSVDIVNQKDKIIPKPQQLDNSLKNQQHKVPADSHRDLKTNQEKNKKIIDSPKIVLSKSVKMTPESQKLLNEIAELVSVYCHDNKIDNSIWIRLSGSLSLKTEKIEKPVPYSSLIDRKFVTTLKHSDIGIFFNDQDSETGVLKQNEFQKTALHPDRSRALSIQELVNRILTILGKRPSKVDLKHFQGGNIFQSLLNSAKEMEKLTSSISDEIGSMTVK